MKVNIKLNIEKKHVFLIVGAMLLLAAVIGVYAYNATGTGGNPSVMGHSVDEIDWSRPIKSAIYQDYGGGGQYQYDVWIQGGPPGSPMGTTRNLALLGDKVNDLLLVNPNSEYTGGTVLGGPVSISGNLCLSNGCKSVWPVAGGSISYDQCIDVDLYGHNCNGAPGCVISGPYISIYQTAGWVVAGESYNSGGSVLLSLTLCHMVIS
jgi:hypothetical protein